MLLINYFFPPTGGAVAPSGLLLRSATVSILDDPNPSMVENTGLLTCSFGFAEATEDYITFKLGMLSRFSFFFN